MTKCYVYAVVFASSFILLASQAWAQGLKAPPEGARGLGRAGGVIALIDDASAISHNPANIADFDQPKMLSAVTIGHLETDYVSPTGEKATTQEPLSFLPYAYGTYPVADGKVVVGIGISGIFGRKAEWDRDSVVARAAPYSTEAAVLNINPTVATKLHETVSVALGADIFYASQEVLQNFPWAALTGDPADPVGVMKFDGDGFALGGNAAIAWQATKRNRFAIVYRSEFDVDIEGDFEVSNFPDPTKLPPPQQGATPASDFETTLKLPNIVGFGYGFEVTETFSIGIDIQWIEHSRLDVITTDIGNNNVLLPSTTFNADWDDGWTYGVGAQWTYLPSWSIRTGVAYNESPVPQQTLTPDLPQKDFIALNLGWGFDDGKHALDLAFSMLIVDTLHVSGNQIPPYDGSYDTDAYLASVGYQRTF